MHLVFCSDQNYLQWCAVPAKTAIEKTNDCSSITIHFILSEDCRDSPQLKKLLEIIYYYNITVCTYYVDHAMCASLPVSGHGSAANYFRLFIPDLLPAQVDKVIYLDTDLIILDSLLPLWETKLEEAPLAAVSNMCLFETEAVRLNVPYMDGTFNSGVLVMNLSVFRKEDLHFKCLHKAIEMGDKIKYWDQDVLNILTRQRWLKLDNCWNVQHARTVNPFIGDKYPIANPKIIHFSGANSKPWQAKVQPYAEEYMKQYYELGLGLPEKNSGSIIRKAKQCIKTAFKKVLGKCARVTILSHIMIRMFNSAYMHIANEIIAISMNKARKANTRNTTNRVLEIISQFFPRLTVSHGPFKGMKYPSLEAVSSEMLPKLSGSYEVEISHKFTAEFLSQFTDFFDVGCAEGYYAVGAATIAPSLRIHAYDTNHQALAACKSIACLNGVGNNISFGEKFSLEQLAQIKKAANFGNCLVLVDCEGAEAVIFSSESYGERRVLQDCTLIIKSYELVCPGMADHISNFFAGSHRLQRVLGVSDLLRPSYYSTFIPVDCDRETAKMILAENRPASLEWLVFQPL